MINVKKNQLLKELTTMKVGGPARFLVEVNNKEEMEEAVQFAHEKELDILVLSGGSNLVVSDNGFNGLVIKIEVKGFEVVSESDNEVVVKVGAGESWDEMVARVVDKGWWGIENLFNIPGSAGAFVVQNAGAYGQECADVLDKIEAYDTREGDIKEIKKDECKLGYRDSKFKREKGRYIILNIYLKLIREGEVKIEYPDLIKYFDEKEIDEPNLKQIRDALIYIRNNKLPEVGKIGSAGSFFKNLILNEDEYEVLEKKVEDNFDDEVLNKLKEIKNKFPVAKGIKIPTAWILDICGLKGVQVGGAKIYDKQPLVIVNEEGDASAEDVMNLFKKARQEVYEKTGMKLEEEPEMVGFSENEINEYFKL